MPSTVTFSRSKVFSPERRRGASIYSMPHARDRRALQRRSLIVGTWALTVPVIALVAPLSRKGRPLRCAPGS